MKPKRWTFGFYELFVENEHEQESALSNATLEQRYLIQRFNAKPESVRRDPVFRSNFWESLGTQEPKKRAKSSIVHLRYRYKQVSVLASQEQTVRFEPPSIFVGRDPSHPKRGCVKWGVRETDVTFNARFVKGDGVVNRVDEEGVEWIATWTDRVENRPRYLYPLPSTPSGSFSSEKFEQARRMRRGLPKIRAQVRSSGDDELIVAFWLIETFGIRVGYLKRDLDVAADTRGCLTLRVKENLELNKGTVTLRFVGKDSVPFNGSSTVPSDVLLSLRRLLGKNKRRGTPVFTSLTPDRFNRVFPEGITGKTFRTMKACVMFEKELRARRDPRLANEAVARFLNHRSSKDPTKLVLSTSIENYVDPRIYVAFCKRGGVEVDKRYLPRATEVSVLYEVVDPGFTF